MASKIILLYEPGKANEEADKRRKKPRGGCRSAIANLPNGKDALRSEIDTRIERTA